VSTERTSGVPSAADLIEAVTEYLTSDLLPGAEGATRYQLRVAIAALQIALADLTRGQAAAADHAGQLAALGVRDDAELAAQIRAGLTPDRYAQVRQVLRRQVDAQVALLPHQGRQ
jgi:hypothetical protein